MRTPLRQWLRPPRRMLVVFLATTLSCLAALGWLGWKYLDHIAGTDAQASLETATDTIAAEIRRSIADLESQLERLLVLPEAGLDDAMASSTLPISDDAILVAFDAEAVRASPRRRLLYYPVLAGAEGPYVSALLPAYAYADAAADPRAAIELYEALAESGENERVRAEAMLHLARVQASLGRTDQALASYAALRDPNVLVDGRPAELFARLSRCTLLKELGRRAQLIDDARELSRDLHGGRWQLTRAAYQHFAKEVRLLDPDPTLNVRPDPRAEALADIVQRLWEEWQDSRAAAGPAAGRMTRVVNTQNVFQIWRSTQHRFIALVGGPRFLEDRITAPIRGMLDAQGIQLALTDGSDGRTVLSHGDRSVVPSRAAVRLADAKLPWTLQTGRTTSASDPGRFRTMPQLLIALLVFLGLFVMTGTYFSVRAMTREMEAVRLKSEFVAAVSHEFRTPLTLLRQFSDLLVEDRVTSEQERRRYYAALQRGTRRLTRLVEDLLDFGRMEAGSRAFPLEPVLAHDLVATLVAEFQDEYRSKGYAVEASWQAPLDVVIQADPAALGRAVWNLLDNAVKYSPASRTIWVTTAFVDDHWRIDVRDRGLGIPAEEQQAVFRKFVRGAARDGHRISGTGLGLALVEQIVEAHGGRVSLESAVGAGSTFTISLPATRAARVLDQPQWRAS